MSSSTKKTPSETLKVGDTFNETDEDAIIEVTAIHKDLNPPFVLCVPIQSDGEATEEEYDVASQDPKQPAHIIFLQTTCKIRADIIFRLQHVSSAGC